MGPGGLKGPEGAEGPEGTGGPRAAGTRHGAGGRSQDHSQTNFACNSIGPNFNKPRKRCNSNDANSIFEQAAGELHAKVMIDSHNWATCSNPRPRRGAGGRRQGLAGHQADTQPHVSTPGPTGTEDASGPGEPSRSARGPWQGPVQTNFACNSIGPNFNKPRKRCNCNDANSIFEQAAGELHAKVMIDSQNWATCSNPRPGRTTSRRAEPKARGADGSRAGRRPRRSPAPQSTRNARNTRGATQQLGTAAPHRPTRERVGCLAAPHPSSTPGLSTAVNQPQSINQHSLRRQCLRGADLRCPAARQPGGDQRGHDGHDAHADQL